MVCPFCLTIPQATDIPFLAAFYFEIKHLFKKIIRCAEVAAGWPYLIIAFPGCDWPFIIDNLSCFIESLLVIT
jgi:hypothetical protein